MIIFIFIFLSNLIWTNLQMNSAYNFSKISINHYAVYYRNVKTNNSAYLLIDHLMIVIISDLLFWIL